MKIGRKLKSDKAEMESRVNRIFDLMMAGISCVKIFQQVTDPNKDGWKMCERTFWSYVKLANLRFQECAKIHREEEFGKAITRLNLLFMSSLKIQDYKSCLAVQKELNELVGLKTVRVELAATVNANISTILSKPEAIDRLNALEKLNSKTPENNKKSP